MPDWMQKEMNGQKSDTRPKTGKGGKAVQRLTRKRKEAQDDIKETVAKAKKKVKKFRVLGNSQKIAARLERIPQYSTERTRLQV